MFISYLERRVVVMGQHSSKGVGVGRAIIMSAISTRLWPPKAGDRPRQRATTPRSSPPARSSTPGEQSIPQSKLRSADGTKLSHFLCVEVSSRGALHLCTTAVNVVLPFTRERCHRPFERHRHQLPRWCLLEPGLLGRRRR